MRPAGLINKLEGGEIINIFKKKPQKNRSAVAFFMGGDSDVFTVDGYKPLAKDENVLRCVYKIADLVSNMTIMLMENGEKGDKRIKNEFSKKIDIRPNNNMTRKSFIHKIVVDMCIHGNCVLYPEYKGEWLDNLQFINDCTFKPIRNTYQIIKNGTVYEQDEVLHFVLNPDYNYPFRGCGIAPLIKDTVKNIAQANKTKEGFLQSKWKPSLVVSIGGDCEDLKTKEGRDKVLNDYTETYKVGDPWLIPAGEIDIKTIQPLTLQDLAIQDSITLDLKTIACAIGIPPFMVGIGDFNKDAYNNFISTTVMSYATIIQQEFTRKIVYSQKQYFKLNRKSLMHYGLQEQTEFVKNLWSMGMLNKNEGRTEFDYSPVDSEGMDDFTVLENYLNVSDLSKQKKLVQDVKNKIEAEQAVKADNEGGV